MLQVVEPHLNGPGGDCRVFWSAEAREAARALAQGVSPAAATIDEYRARGLERVPGTGVLAACVPGSFGGWLLLLEQFGTWPLADVLEYAIGYAERGYPVIPGITKTIGGPSRCSANGPASAELYLPAPRPGSTFRNPQLAATWRRRAAGSGGTVEGARRVYYEGFVADEMDQLLACARRRADRRRHGAVACDARAAGDVRLPRADGVQDRGVGAGPSALQQLALLEGYDVAA